MKLLIPAIARLSAVMAVAFMWAAPSVDAQEVTRANVVASEPAEQLGAEPEDRLDEAPVNAVPVDIAVLGGLNKITARVSTIELPLGREVAFGTLTITARTCAMRPPTEPPETTAFLEISDSTMAEGEGAFTGWMFASSPAVSALEHPVYDVWVLDCKMASGDASAGN